MAVIDEQLYTPAAIAEQLGTTERHVRSLIQDRKLSSYRIGGKVRVAASDLQAFLDSGHRVAVL